MLVKDLKRLLLDIPDDLEIRYQECGFNASLWYGPDEYQFQVVEGKFLIPAVAQEEPE